MNRLTARRDMLLKTALSINQLIERANVSLRQETGKTLRQLTFMIN